MDKKPNPKHADLTVRILEQIRDQVTATNGRLDDLRAEVGTLRTELTDHIERLEHRQSADSVRLATEVAEVAGAVVEMRDMMRERKADRAVLGDHEQRIRALERKTA